jgi:hypothetical protein
MEKTHIPRTFTITDDGCSFKSCSIYRKYLKLRPKHVTSRRFFLNYRNGKCINANVGTNTMAAIPSKVAKFLNLPNPIEYTRHCFLRTSATMLVEGGADLLTLKKHGGWCLMEVWDISHLRLTINWLRLSWLTKPLWPMPPKL